MPKRIERRRNGTLAILITMLVLVFAGVLLYAGGVFGEALTWQETCESQGMIAVQKAVAGYACVVEAP